MSNYIYNVPPPYQDAGSVLQRAQSVQYSYQQQPPPGSVPGGPPGAIAPGTAASAPQDNKGNQYQYQAPPVPPPPATFNNPPPHQGQWGNAPSQQQSWKPPAPPQSAPPAPAATYNPGTYGPMPGAQIPNSPTRYNTGSSGLGQGALNTSSGYNQSIQNQSYGYNAAPQQPSAPPQQQFQNQPPSSQPWSQSQNTQSQQERPPPPLPPRPASVIGNNRPTSVIYAPQNQLHTSPVQANAQLPQHTQTPQQHQSPYTTPQSSSQNPLPQQQQQQQQSNYYGQYQNQNQVPIQPPKSQGYQQDGRQDQQAQVPYSSQPSQSYDSQLQTQASQHQQPSTSYQYNQPQSQAQLQQQPSQYGQYDTSAPPVPSKIPAGSYFPPVAQPPQQAQNNGQQYPTSNPNQVADAGTSPDAWVTSPNESQPAYIPPSLSGHGVSAYQPSNANPQLGVYIPPPPENVPAWSQQQHAPLAPPAGAKRFKYTPPTLHPDYQPGGSKYNPQQVAQPAQPYQPNPMAQQQQEWASQPIEAQYPGQPGVEGWNQQVGGWQPVSHGDAPAMAPGPPPEQQVTWGQQLDPIQAQNPQQPQNQQYQQPPQGQFHQQQQNWGEHQMQHPPHSHNQQHHHAQYLEQPDQVTPADIHTQSQQLQHQPRISLSQTYENANKHDAQRPLTTTPPVQATPPPPSQNANAGQTHSGEKDARKTSVPPSSLSASALGFGGPGDWEHFGLSAEDESVDDTALTTKKEEPVTQAQSSMAELPSNPSPIMSKTARQDFHEPEAWPSPPAPAPLAVNRPSPTSSNAVHDGTKYAPTPPPNNMSIYPHPERTASVVSVEDHEDSSIDGAIQTWARQQSQLSQQPKYEAENQRAPLVPNANQAFAMNDGGFPSPTQQDKPTIVPSNGERSQTPTQAQYPQQQRPQESKIPITPAPASQTFVMDDGFSNQHQQNEPTVSTSISQPSKPTTKAKTPTPLPITSQSFTMDDGGWSNQTQAHKPTVSAQVPEKPRGADQTKPVPASSQSFSVDDGGGDRSVQIQQPNSNTKAPSPQKLPGTTQPKPASNLNFTLDNGPLSSQPLQFNDTSFGNGNHSQLSPKKRAAPEPVGPFPNLDPWYKASLERYAAMVNAESLAATDEERTKLFTDFMMEESRLRGVRYGVGIGVGLRNEEKRKSSEFSTSVGRAQPTTPPRGRQPPKPVSTSVPPTSSDDDIQYSPGGRPRIRSQSATAKSRNPAGVSDLRRESASRKSQPTATPPPQKYVVAAPQKPIDQPSSPGRNAPIPVDSTESMTSRTTAHAPSSPPAKSGGIRSRPITPGSPKGIGSAPDNKPAYKPFRPGTEGQKATAESLYKPYIPPSASLTHITENRNYSQVPATADTKSNKPVYVPFTLSPPVDTGSGGNSNARGPPIQRKTSLDSAPQRPRAGATNEHAETLLQEDSNGKAAVYGKAATPFPRRRDTTDIATVKSAVGPIKEHFGPLLPPPAEKGGHSAGRKGVPTPSQGEDLMAGLQRILPSRRGPKTDGNIYISPTISCMDSLPDELNFISDAISAWEIKAKKVRETHDRERRTRQEEQEEHTDQLFSESQIGYGDISALEEDFKLSEREKKSKEDKEEYESFVSEVFARSYDHFQEEIKQLMDHYVGCMDLMKDTVAGKEALEPYTDKPNLSQIMAVFVVLHKKIEMRHEAVVQVVMERDKRFKKTVIQPLYSAGNIPEMKKMEKHFDEADKKSALEAARKKDQRAKRFMRSIEENTMKTLREDLNYMDEVAQEVHKILQELPPSLSANYSGIAQALSDELAFAQTILKTLARKSEDLMQLFHTAALEINTAEYGVSHAIARLQNESPDTTDRLREDMLKENDRLAKELENRISVVKGDFQKSNEEVSTLLQRLEKPKVAATAPEQGAQGSPNAVDPEYDVRMVKALEAAKKRNAGKGGGAEGSS